MTDEQQNDELDVVFVGTRETGGKRQLVFRANGEHFLMSVDTRAFQAGKRVLAQGVKVAAAYEEAAKQGVVEA